MRVLGVDPGIRGGLALLERGLLVWADDIPVMGVDAKKRVNASRIHEMLTLFDPIEHAYIERAQAFPQQGASSGFMYGRAVGAIEAVILCCGIPLTTIEPRMWKKHFGLKGDDKEAARQKALMLFPSGHRFMTLKQDHGRAEAALIALYGAPRLPISNDLASPAAA